MNKALFWTGTSIIGAELSVLLLVGLILFLSSISWSITLIAAITFIIVNVFALLMMLIGALL